MPTFEPLPEDTEILHSFDDVTPDEHDPNDDGDDALASAYVPGLLERLGNRLKGPQ